MLCKISIIISQANRTNPEIAGKCCFNDVVAHGELLVGNQDVCVCGGGGVLSYLGEETDRDTFGVFSINFSQPFLISRLCILTILTKLFFDFIFREGAQPNLGL